RQLGERGEDPHAVVGSPLRGSADERGLREVELGGQRLALLGGQLVGTEDDGQRIAVEGPRSEHIDDLVVERFRGTHGPDGNVQTRDRACEVTNGQDTPVTGPTSAGEEGPGTTVTRGYASGVAGGSGVG